MVAPPLTLTVDAVKGATGAITGIDDHLCGTEGKVGVHDDPLRKSAD